MYYLFQSLIGRLKTKTAVDEVREMIVFQSLIGRLKTSLYLLAQILHQRFQSLIGRLKTAALSDKQQAELRFNPS